MDDVSHGGCVATQARKRMLVEFGGGCNSYPPICTMILWPHESLLHAIQCVTDPNFTHALGQSISEAC
eukprot:1148234-Pelagomonas_calceolata.AAC.8